MGHILLTGATGVFGQAVHPRLQDAGHEVRAASRSPPAGDPGEWVELDLVDGTGVQRAVADIDVVVHAASDPQGETEAVEVDGTTRLIEAAADAGVSSFVYVSIVGIDEIPYSYYQHKLAAERAVDASPVPSTIVRSTQFHPFLGYLLRLISRLPIWLVPKGWKLQPIDVGEAADAVVEHASPGANGERVEVGGPDVLTARALGEAYRTSIGARRPIVPLPIPGRIAAAFRAGHATCPDADRGSVTWSEWLADQDGRPGSDRY